MKGKLDAWEKGPLLLTLLDGLAAQTFEDIDVETDPAKESGEAVIFDRLDKRYPNVQPENRMAELLDDLFELKWETQGSKSNYAGRAVPAFSRAKQEGVIFPPETQGYMLL